jgi:hypothetical protein
MTQLVSPISLSLAKVETTVNSSTKLFIVDLFFTKVTAQAIFFDACKRQLTPGVTVMAKETDASVRFVVTFGKIKIMLQFFQTHVPTLTRELETQLARRILEFKSAKC